MTHITATDELFECVKRELQISWTDPDTDARTLEHINSGIAEIDEIAGEPQDYSVPGRSRRLLIEYARYARAEALDDWRTNYFNDLIGLQVKRIAHEAETSNDEKD